MPEKTLARLLPLLILGCLIPTPTVADDENGLRPLLDKHCVKCHGQDPEDINGEVDLFANKTVAQWVADPKFVQKVYEAVDGESMPPDTEPPMPNSARKSMLVSLKQLLQQAAQNGAKNDQQLNLRRLNRFQYNNSIRDLFDLDRDVFSLPEKLMTRKQGYLQRGNQKMPDRVQVTSHALDPKPGMQNVRAFPKDLRASHGFDNQANQLTLSPLLLDSFLRISVSIVESPDFNSENVGIWQEFFARPEGDFDREAEIRKRLAPFMMRAFRRPISDSVLDRYVDYAIAKMESGLEFTEAMKKVASAVVSSPKFYFRASGDEYPQFRLASELSYFLWASCPDQALLDLAASGQLADASVLKTTVRRMMGDAKIERFLDTFPAQWMQLENVLAATPDPDQYRLFSIDTKHPASLQMVLEPLLLFDAVFIENRPIEELVAPNFAYHSDFLTTWYTSDLRPAPVDTKKIETKNLENDNKRKELTEQIKLLKQQRAELVDPIRAKLLAERGDSAEGDQADLEPYSVWEFDGDLKDSVHSLHLQPHGKIRFDDGMVHLKRSHLISEKLSMDLKAKTLEVWFQLDNLKQRGGGVMGVQGPGDFFDTIVLGERKPKHWISGSNGFSRTKDFPESYEEDRVNELIHLVMVYDLDGTTRLYRDGKPYGESFNKGKATFPKDKTSILFGVRHLPAGGNRLLDVSIDRALLYDRALTADEVAASANQQRYIRPDELVAAMNEQQRSQKATFDKQLDDLQKSLSDVPDNRDPKVVAANAGRAFDNRIKGQLRSSAFRRVSLDDPRYGGIITNAAMMSMTSGPKRTHPIARGAWIIEVIFNDPPPPPPNDVPPLSEEESVEHLTIREKFAKHRENPDCAGCHSRLDPLGFAMENFDITGRWREQYKNGRKVDASGKLLNRYDFDGVVEFKQSIGQEKRRLAKAFTKHLLRFALSRELGPRDLFTVDTIVDKTEQDQFRLQTLMREVVLSDSFRRN